MKKYSVLIIAFLFLFIYYPPIFPANILHGLAAFSWIMILRYLKKGYINNIPIFKIKRIQIFLFTIVLYISIVTVINGKSLTSIYTYVIWFIDIIPICTFLSVYFINRKYRIKEFFILLLITGTLQGLIAVLAFIFPNIQLNIIGMMLKYGFTDIIVQLSNHRMYGLSYNFNYTMPIVQSTLAIISIYLAINSNISYLWFTPLLVFSSLINARISIIILVTGLFIIPWTLRNSLVKKVISMFLVGISILIILPLILTVIKDYSPQTYFWVNEGYKEIHNVFNGDNSGTYFSYVLDKNKYTLPSYFGLVFGRGTQILNSLDGIQSDIGFINDIWTGGVLFSVSIYLFIWRLLKSIYKSEAEDDISNKFIAIYFFTVFVLSNIKGLIISVNEFTNLFFLIVFFIISNEYFKKKFSDVDIQE